MNIKLTIAGMMAALAVGALAHENVIQNADMSIADGMGGPLGWEAFGYQGSHVFAQGDGNGVITLTSDTNLRGFFKQDPVGMKSGGKYRFSAEVRSSLTNDAGFCFLCWPNEWNKEAVVDFPSNTAGKWQRVEQELTMPPSKSPDQYGMGFAGKGVGAIQLRNLRLEAVTDEDEAAVKRIDMTKFHPLKTRIVPIDPLFGEISATKAELTCYWPGEPQCGVSNCTLGAVLLFNGVTPGKRDKAKFNADGRAHIKFGVIGKCNYTLALTVNAPDGSLLATNAYSISGHDDLPQGPDGRRLNNFVTELVNAELKNGEVRFFRPKAGWVWISFEQSARDTCGYLDDQVPAAVFARPDEPQLEAMRYVSAGWHRLTVKGATGGRLRIHQVKRLEIGVWTTKGGSCDFSGDIYRYPFQFAQRFLLGAANTVHANEEILRNPYDMTHEYYVSRGCKWRGWMHIHYHFPRRDDGDAIYRQLNDGAWQNGWDCNLDEDRIGDTRHNLVEMSEVLWRMVGERPRQVMDVFWGDATNVNFNDPKAHTALLSAIFNSGDGRGISLPEVYAPALATPEATDLWINLFAAQVRDAGRMVPGGRDRTCFHLAPYVNLWSWSDEPCPETDIKAHYARLLCTFATDSRFAENAGLSTGANRECEEELRRWQARCFRYYGVEGGTNDLARQYGFKWNPALIRNPDFATGLEGWTVQCAEGGAIKPARIKKFGHLVQHRMKAPGGTGDTFAEFTASSKGANRMSQKFTGLTPGKFYAVRCCAVNGANANQRQKERPQFAFSMQVENAEVIPGLGYTRITRNRPTHVPGKGCVYLRHQRIVFKATSNEATLVLTDRGANGELPAPDAKMLVNYVLARPYYCETPEEPYEIARLLHAQVNE